MKKILITAFILVTLPSILGSFTIHNIRCPGSETWNPTFGPSALLTPGGAVDIALNKNGFSLQAGIVLHSLYQAWPPWSNADRAFTFHAGIGLVLIDIGYSRMVLSSGESAHGWHLCLGIPIPLRIGHSDAFEREFVKLYWRPTWVYFASGYEVFHEVGLSLRFKIMLEK